MGAMRSISSAGMPAAASAPPRSARRRVRVVDDDVNAVAEQDRALHALPRGEHVARGAGGWRNDREDLAGISAFSAAGVSQ